MTTTTSNDQLADVLLDISAVAELCQVSQRTVLRWVRQGYIPQPLRVGRRLLRFRRDDISAWLARGCPSTD